MASSIQRHSSNAESNPLYVPATEGYIVSHPNFDVKSFDSRHKSALIIDELDSNAVNILTINLIGLTPNDISRGCDEFLSVIGVRKKWKSDNNMASFCRGRPSNEKALQLQPVVNLDYNFFITDNNPQIVRFQTQIAQNASGFLFHYSGL